MSFKKPAILPILLVAFTIAYSAAVIKPHSTHASHEPSLTLTFVGDVLLNGTVGDLIKAEGPMAPWAGVTDILSRADFSICNLECAVGTTGSPIPGKAWTFRADPATLEGLKQAGIDAVSLANNHTLDFGTECMLETVNLVRAAGIQAAGAGANLSAAREPVIFEKNGLKVGFLATNMIYPDVSWGAGDNSPGQAIDSTWRPQIVTDIKNLSAQVDVVAVYVHWSAERVETPEKWVLPVAKAMREAGAQLVIGSHPHVMNGFDYDGKNLTAYSLGNFVFSTRPELPKCQIGSALEVTVKKGRVEAASVVPTSIVWGKTVLQGEPAKSDTLRWLSALSNAWSTDVDAQGNILPVLFTDLSGHWSRPTVTKLVLSGAIEGYPDGTFRPEASILKSEFAALFVRAIASPEQIASVPKGEGFSLCDEDSWAYPYLNYFSGRALISGSDPKWTPFSACSRLDILEVMRKHAQETQSPAGGSTTQQPSEQPQPPSGLPRTPAQPPSPPIIPPNLQAFTDVSGLDQESVNTASWAVEVGLVKGYEDGTLRLASVAKRAEIAELLWRYLQLL